MIRGCFLGAIMSLFIGERLGRRKCIMAGCVILSIGAALQCSAYSIPHLIVGRIIAGVGNGLNTSTIHYGFSYNKSEAQFRFPIALQIVFAIATFIGVVFLPESPRWLIKHGKEDKARQVIWSLQDNAREIDETDAVVSLDVQEISQAIREEQAASTERSFKLIFQNGQQRFLYRTLLGMGGQMMQQLSGINLITYYATVIFEESVGMNHNTALLLAGFNGVAYFFSSLIPIWVIDRLGRRKLMMFAVTGQGVCMAILAGTVWDGGHAAGLVATVMLFLFNFFFAVGLLAIPWLLPAEYSPLAIRTRSAALATATNWIFTFLVVEITPVSISNIGYRTYIYFAGMSSSIAITLHSILMCLAVFNFCFLPLIYFFYPEARNLTLEQIDHLFTGEKVKLYWHPSMGMAGDADFRIAQGKDVETVNAQHVE
ncbi:Sugar transporter STL1 [Penicillium rolfsii]|nr:Sugar transporter STL1 [Penicillium rolfsii]